MLTLCRSGGPVKMALLQRLVDTVGFWVGGTPGSSPVEAVVGAWNEKCLESISRLASDTFFCL